jgi:hypothetical protein
MKALRNILCTGMISLAGLGLVGCEKAVGPTITMQTETKELNQEPQYSVKRVGTFADNLAYGGKRGIYEITNERTKKKYLGVSGIGIIEPVILQGYRTVLEVER